MEHGLKRICADCYGFFSCCRETGEPVAPARPQFRADDFVALKMNPCQYGHRERSLNGERVAIDSSSYF